MTVEARGMTPTSVTLRERSEVAGSISPVILHEVAGAIGVGSLELIGVCPLFSINVGVMYCYHQAVFND